MSGKSDQGGCPFRSRARRFSLSLRMASSGTMATAAPFSISEQTSTMSLQRVMIIPAISKTLRAATASRLVGARRRIRSSSVAADSSLIVGPRKRTIRLAVDGRPGEHPLEIGERLPDRDATTVEPQLPDGPLVPAAPLLHDRDGLPHLAHGLEVAEKDDSVREVGYVDGRLHRPDEAVLGDQEERHDALVPEVGQEFMELGDEEPLLGHGIEVAVQAVDDYDSRPPRAVGPLDGRPDPVGELARRQLGRVDGLDADAARLDVLRDVHPEARRPLQDGLQPLVEGEDRCPLAAGRRGPRILEGERRLAAAGGAEEDRTGPVRDAPAHQQIQLGVAGFEEAALLAELMLGGDEPRKDVEAPRCDDEVVVATPVLLPPELRDAEASPLGPVLGRELLQAHDPVGDALEL